MPIDCRCVQHPGAGGSGRVVACSYDRPQWAPATGCPTTGDDVQLGTIDRLDTAGRPAGSTR
jgi:hypothetical protein